MNAEAFLILKRRVFEIYEFLVFRNYPHELC